MRIMRSGGTFSFLELLEPSEFMSWPEAELNFLLGRRTLSAGFAFLTGSSSKEMTNPLDASASSFSLSVFIAASVSASCSVRWIPAPELDLSEDGPEAGRPAPGCPGSAEPDLRLCLKVDEMVGRVFLVGDGDCSFSDCDGVDAELCTRYVWVAIQWIKNHPKIGPP